MTVDQPIMLIAGIAEDRDFIHMCYVATHLSQMLPNFQYERICKRPEEWKLWLENICKTHDWSHASSQLVWREVGTRTGNSTYVGGATQFWEFIYEYYGIESRLTDDELKLLKQDFVQEIKIEAHTNALRAAQRKLQIAIFGGDKSMCDNLLVELFFIKEQQMGDGISIKLYNVPPYNPGINEPIKDITEIAKDSQAATIVRTTSAALVNCDILIILDEMSRHVTMYSQNDETTEHWLNRNRAATLELAAQINNFAPNHLKVIFCSDGPTCFNAGVLAAAVTKLDANNIAVVSAHLGLEILRETSNSISLPLKEMGCPPVWGFLGIKHFVDVCNTVQIHEIYRPNNRALYPPEGTTLSLGVKHAELRSIFYIAHDRTPYSGHDERRRDGVQRCKAICDLLRLWYGESCDNDGEIISLGICSDGTFGIPGGIFFSQPVYLREGTDGSRIWVPCSGFPIPNHPNWIFNNLIETAEILFEKLIRFTKSDER